jgi:hypothetical protein
VTDDEWAFIAPCPTLMREAKRLNTVTSLAATVESTIDADQKSTFEYIVPIDGQTDTVNLDE